MGITVYSEQIRRTQQTREGHKAESSKVHKTYSDLTHTEKQNKGPCLSDLRGSLQQIVSSRYLIQVCLSGIWLKTPEFVNWAGCHTASPYTGIRYLFCKSIYYNKINLIINSSKSINYIYIFIPGLLSVLRWPKLIFYNLILKQLKKK